ncbi:4-hydroxybenzoate 3-monooxygenase [Paucibacter sp. PLA-PC-4]|uniref:4-hydroxybenzoate 3-monooxygenase n=1 Tax=Paucibacter sp. PLA-PC-4 TaxID=2993655 RepID=UPI00224AD16C|nr:4-hydroxybenzoate 3-monooxygenase [Paucibacter sp. PLA-PC-4]MCX2865781.1 4-hydroxybenzoate 3-monooxygenase [Paucibacter sp. PLA-PC-4]
MKTQIAIIGAGPAGLLLSHLLHRQGIHSIVLERQTRDHVLSRIRAGVLESTSVEVLRAAGLADRMDREGHPHDGMRIAWAGRDSFYVNSGQMLGRPFVTYGQTQIQQDLFAAADARGQSLLHGVHGITLHGIDGASPSLAFTHQSENRELKCDYIVGCDGFHGPSRRAMPAGVLREYEKVYPFGWLGIMARVKPLDDVTYAYHPRGFALASRRNDKLGRFYIQVPLEDKIEDWPDGRFWAEFKARFPQAIARQIEEGPSIEKSIAPLRSFVAEPMSHGRLFLAGDAAHIVPPTGAKGLNLAISDVHYLSRALASRYHDASEELLGNYSATALRRVWSSVRTSWHLTNLLHSFPAATDFERRAQEHELAYLQSSTRAQAALAEQYAGLPLEI